MEKRSPHYQLADIQSQMDRVEALRLTRTARQGMIDLRMKLIDVLAVVQGLTSKDFDKSMTTHADHKVWQDVYKPVWKGVDLYVKFQRDDDGFYFTISFKER